jgi:hypothetical protein
VRLSATVGFVGQGWVVFVQRFVQRLEYLAAKRERQREDAQDVVIWET